ncbi:MAG: PhoH family protein [Ignavibacteriaceae bacterium]|nr:PhoH family protein [Ignavibacteriaceae bacterium]
MSALERKIVLENTDMATLLGTNDNNLKLLENRFNTTISVRGENILIKGTESDVNLVEKVIREMSFVLNTSGKLKNTDVNTILDINLHSNGNLNDKEYDSVILFTKNEAIKPKTDGQQIYIKMVQENDICFAIGPAGTGKTYLAVALAVAAMKKGIVNKIVLARPAVEAGESLGFLPGDFREKIDPYLRPLYDALDEMLPQEKLKNFLEKKMIEIVPLAYMRGRTLNYSYVILDEAQNATDTQMKMFLTRLGASSKAIITGDITQIDLPSKQVSGLVKAQEILKNINGIGFAYFDKSDVVRHKLVKDIIDAYEKFYDREKK